jgi:hypothetical protein
MGKTYRRDSDHKYHDYRKGKNNKPNKLKHSKSNGKPHKLKPDIEDADIE